MKRGSTKSIAELVRVMCREEGLETPLNEYRLINAWSKVLGPAVQSYTKNLQIHNQVLYVTLTSSVLRRIYRFYFPWNAVHKLNDYVKAQVITDIVFR